MDRHDFADVDLLCRQRVADAVGDERPHAFFIEMLELAATAKRKMLAGRRRVVRSVDQATSGIDDIPRRSMCDIAAIGGHAIAACGYPDNFSAVCHSAPCPHGLKQSTGVFGFRICGGVLALDLGRQPVFVIPRTDFDHSIAEEADFRLVEAVSRRKPATVGQYVETPEATVRMANNQYLACTARNLLGSTIALECRRSGQCTFDLAIESSLFCRIALSISQVFVIIAATCGKAGEEQQSESKSRYRHKRAFRPAPRDA